MGSIRSRTSCKAIAYAPSSWVSLYDAKRRVISVSTFLHSALSMPSECFHCRWDDVCTARASHQDSSPPAIASSASPSPGTDPSALLLASPPLLAATPSSGFLAMPHALRSREARLSLWKAPAKGDCSMASPWPDSSWLATAPISVAEAMLSCSVSIAAFALRRSSSENLRF
eukprot:2170988-Lingulodinium_polyedra.AAC.2